MSCTDCKDGQRGLMGLRGPKGDTGASGATGARGAQGTQGAQGLTGASGVSGSNGAKGNVGIQGIQGPAGIPGNDGLNGATGQRGANGLDGTDGSDGPPGAAGPMGPQGATGIQGVQGNGRYIIGSYVSLTGIGNSDPIADETPLFTQNLTGSILVNDGDEIELLINTEYIGSDLVYLIFELDPLNRYVYPYQNTDPDIRSISIIITRVNPTTQFWSIQDVCRNIFPVNIKVQALDTFTTSFDLSLPMTFQILADNTVIGVDQVLLKKCSMYLNRRQ